MYKQLDEFGTRSKTLDCVFLWMVSDEHKVYENYPEKNKKMADLKARTVLVGLRRKDNAFGTVGGKVDDGEDLLTGLYRECEEEIGIKLGMDFKPSDIKELVSFDDNGVHIHSYYVSVSSGYMKYAKAEFSNATHGAEWCGVNEVVIDEKMNDFMKNQFAATAKLELELLLGKLDG